MDKKEQSKIYVSYSQVAVFENALEELAESTSDAPTLPHDQVAAPQRLDSAVELRQNIVPSKTALGHIAAT